ncbi:type I-E CRISPR-associated protein Cse1/CasA [Streptomyces sp. CB02460]|uniref:type I-E CRISPR-associated protein Cse1/CasA n=1 Tax=Streptomyces sp. CB02460 TaxID=1703941 RepID=UPI00093B89AE|nr:type I-E CRISPR-associated protein Cse1/CasA [Streptomyces sp. CB02460]
MSDDPFPLPASAFRPFAWDPRYSPCVPTVTLDGHSAHHSLCALLRHADELFTVECSSPGEAVSVIEYLLAICFAAGVCPGSDEEWRDWIESGRALSPAADWLDGRPDDDWDLFHPSAPLGQSSELAGDFGDSSTGTAQLVIEHAGDYNQHFDHHHLERAHPLPAAEAFRAMLTQHAYGLYGRARMSGKRLGAKVTNLAAGRLNGRIRVVALGRTLGETLRLNLYPSDGPTGALNTSWTTPDGFRRRRFEGPSEPRTPEGPADLHSALGRSVLLHPAAGPGGQTVVDRVLIGAGEVLAIDQERHSQDAVFATTAGGVRKPLWPSPTRALWQDAHALYGAVRDDRTGLYARLRSLRLRSDDAGAPYQLWAVGLLANKTLPVIWTYGSYPYAPHMERHLYQASYRGSVLAEYLAWSLRKAAVIAAETAFPAMRTADEAGQVARLDARQMFWPAAEEPFYALLDEVIDRGPEEDDPVSEPCIAYAALLLKTARAHLLQRLDALHLLSADNNLARARAVQLFENLVTARKAPAELRGETAHG